jgi:hypothetical protein
MTPHLITFGAQHNEGAEGKSRNGVGPVFLDNQHYSGIRTETSNVHINGTPMRLHVTIVAVEK